MHNQVIEDSTLHLLAGLIGLNPLSMASLGLWLNLYSTFIPTDLSSTWCFSNFLACTQLHWLVSATGSIQDSIEMKFNWPWVRWEVGLSGPFKHFCLEHSSTKELFCSFGSARLLSYWFHNVPPQALILFLDIAQNHVSGGQPALNEEAKSLCILEEKKWVYFHIVCLCVCFCARIRDNQRMPCRESSGDSWSLAVRHLIIGWGPF